MILSKPCLAVDLGGTIIKAGVVQGERVLSLATAPAHSEAGLAAQLPRLQKMLLDLCNQAGVSLQNLGGVGVCVPMLIDAGGQRVVRALKNKYSDAENVDLVQWARESFSLPLRLENDANAACMGEWKFGAGRGCNDLVVVTLGTGIGVSVVIQGHPLRGKHGQAGILSGHIVVVPNGRPCACGGCGCVEAETSAALLPELARADAAFQESALSRESFIDYQSVFRAAGAGDSLSIRLRNRSLDYWSAHAVSLIHAFDPELVVIGGGIAKSAAVIIPHIQQYVNKNALTPWGTVRIVPEQLGQHASLIGMAALFGAESDRL
jgi:glucokinase